MNSRVNFVYSNIYDEIFRRDKGTKEFMKKHNESYPSYKKIAKYVKKIEKKWGPYGKKILNEMSVITGLKWKEREVKCYVVGSCIPFSDPLTIGLRKQADFIDTLIHELFHQILYIQNTAETEKSWDYFFKKYGTESQKTKVHIPLHAFHWKIYLKFFSKKRLKRDIWLCEKFPDYKKSWEIVQKEGYENIIKEFKKRIK